MCNKSISIASLVGSNKINVSHTLHVCFKSQSNFGNETKTENNHSSLCMFQWKISSKHEACGQDSSATLTQYHLHFLAVTIPDVVRQCDTRC